MAMGRWTEDWASSTTGTQRSYRSGKPIVFAIPTYVSGSIYLKMSTNDGSNWETIKTFTAATTEAQAFRVVSERALYRFDCSGTGLGNALVINGEDVTSG